MPTHEVTVQTPFGPMTNLVEVKEDGTIDVKPLLDASQQVLATLNKVSGQLTDLNALVIKLLLKD